MYSCAYILYTYNVYNSSPPDRFPFPDGGPLYAAFISEFAVNDVSTDHVHNETNLRGPSDNGCYTCIMDFLLSNTDFSVARARSGKPYRGESDNNIRTYNVPYINNNIYYITYVRT